jgi:hypothetical protein
MQSKNLLSSFLEEVTRLAETKEQRDYAASLTEEYKQLTKLKGGLSQLQDFITKYTKQETTCSVTEHLTYGKVSAKITQIFGEPDVNNSSKETGV